MPSADGPGDPAAGIPAAGEEPPEAAGRPVALPPSLRFALAGNIVVRIAGPSTAIMLTLYLAEINDRHYPIGPFAVGALTAAFYVTELTGSPLLGALSDRRGRRWLLVLGPLLGALAVGLTAATTAFVALLLARLIEGVSTAASSPAILGQLSEETEGDIALRGRVLSLFEVTTALGAFVGTATATGIWLALGRGGFLAVALLYLLAAVLFRGVREGRAPARRAAADAHSWRDSLALIGRHRDLLRFLPAWLSLSAVTSLWFTQAIYQMKVARPEFADQFLSGRFAENAGGLGVVLALFALTFSAGIIGWGYIGLRRLHELIVMRVALGAMIGVCAALWVVNHSGDNAALRAVAIAVFAALVLVESGFAPAAVAYLARLSGAVSSERGLIMGLYTVITGGGSLLGAALGAPFAQWGAPDGILLLTVLLAGFALTLLFRLRERE